MVVNFRVDHTPLVLTGETREMQENGTPAKRSFCIVIFWISIGFEVVDFVQTTRRWYDKGFLRETPERCRGTWTPAKACFMGPW